jgi:hypothetical protein
MDTVVDLVLSWRAFAASLLIFGFAPRLVLRIIVLAFDRDDPRREELLAEIHAVPRIERPFWVVEQLEVAVSEGLKDRVLWALTGRVIVRWHLSSGVERNRAYPDTFWIPDEEDKAAVEPGDSVKAMFEMDDWGERMWVRVHKVTRRHIVGTLANQPIGIPRLDYGDKVKLKRHHIIDINWREDETEDPVTALPPEDHHPWCACEVHAAS